VHRPGDAIEPGVQGGDIRGASHKRSQRISYVLSFRDGAA
jgi:hypothetical protein